MGFLSCLRLILDIAPELGMGFLQATWAWSAGPRGGRREGHCDQVSVATAGLGLFAFRHLPGHLSLNPDCSLVVSFSCSYVDLGSLPVPPAFSLTPPPSPLLWTHARQAQGWEGRAVALCPRLRPSKLVFTRRQCSASWGALGKNLGN